MARWQDDRQGPPNAWRGDGAHRRQAQANADVRGSEGEREPWRRERYGSGFGQDRAEYGSGYDASRGDYGRGDHEHDLDHDYLNWREAQMRNHDRDYREWREAQHRQYDEAYHQFRNERRSHFVQTFQQWRSQRPLDAHEGGESAQHPGSASTESEFGKEPAEVKAATDGARE